MLFLELPLPSLMDSDTLIKILSNVVDVVVVLIAFSVRTLNTLGKKFCFFVVSWLPLPSLKELLGKWPLQWKITYLRYQVKVVSKIKIQHTVTTIWKNTFIKIVLNVVVVVIVVDVVFPFNPILWKTLMHSAKKSGLCYFLCLFASS